MTSSALEEIERGARVFIDSSIFVYHFTGVSSSCRAFLERCERAEHTGTTSVTVLAEVAHRLMMIEAVQRRLVTPGNVAQKLRKRPDAIRKLHLYSEQVGRIPLMGIEVLALQLDVMLHAGELRARHGLMVNDSIITATAAASGIDAIASGDADFERVGGLTLHRPTDLTPT